MTRWCDETKTKDGRSYQYVVPAPWPFAYHDESKAENIGDKVGKL